MNFIDRKEFESFKRATTQAFNNEQISFDWKGDLVLASYAEDVIEKLEQKFV